jgi:transcription antitermination factor NusG
VAVVKPLWYCVQFNGQRLNGIQDAEKFLEGVARDIFGKDLHDVAVVGERFDDHLFESQSESYFFVRCVNYQSHLPRIRNSSVITRVLPKTDAPDAVPAEEVETFRSSFDVNSAPDPSEGDIVLVRRGYLENLVGVVRDCTQERSIVVFRLFTRHFEEALPFNNLVVLGHVDDVLTQRRTPRNADKNKMRRGHDRLRTSKARSTPICPS